MGDEIETQKLIQEKVKQAKADLKEKKFENAAKLFQEVAKEYEKDSSLSAEAEKYYTKAAKAYFSSGKKGYDKFKGIILKDIMSLLTDPNEKIELLIDGANKLLKVKECKKGAELVSKLKDIYKNPIKDKAVAKRYQMKLVKDKEKAKYYEQLAKEVKLGNVKKIEHI